VKELLAETKDQGTKEERPSKVRSSKVVLATMEDLVDDGEHEHGVVLANVVLTEEEQMCEELRSECLTLYDNRAPWLLDHVDLFVSMTRNNDMVKAADLYLYVYDDNKDAASYEIWDKVGQGIGNLEALETLHVLVSGDATAPIENTNTQQRTLAPDWERLVYILKHLKKNIRLQVSDASETEQDHHLRYAVDVDAFARMLRGQPRVASFVTENMFYRGSLGTVCAALSTLPSLEAVMLGHRRRGETEQGGELTELDPEHMAMPLF
jgi:hypothetical protein